MDRLLLLVILLVSLTSACLIGCGACPQGKPSPDALTGATYHTINKAELPPQAGEYEVIGLVDGLHNHVVKYDEKIYRGGEPETPAAADFFQKHQIKTIVTVTPSDLERQLAEQYGILLVEIPFDAVSGPTRNDIDKLLNTIKEQEGPFYIHCHGGTHRAGVLAMAYRIFVLGWSYDKAAVEYGRLGGDLKNDHSLLESVRVYQ